MTQDTRRAGGADTPEQTFLATASHEIRTPLNGILGTVSLLLETELSPAQREYAETIRLSGARLLDPEQCARLRAAGRVGSRDRG